MAQQCKGLQQAATAAPQEYQHWQALNECLLAELPLARHRNALRDYWHIETRKRGRTGGRWQRPWFYLNLPKIYSDPPAELRSSGAFQLAYGQYLLSAELRVNCRPADNAPLMPLRQSAVFQEAQRHLEMARERLRSDYLTNQQVLADNYLGQWYLHRSRYDSSHSAAFRTLDERRAHRHFRRAWDTDADLALQFPLRPGNLLSDTSNGYRRLQHLGVRTQSIQPTPPSLLTTAPDAASPAALQALQKMLHQALSGADDPIAAAHYLWESWCQHPALAAWYLPQRTDKALEQSLGKLEKHRRYAQQPELLLALQGILHQWSQEPHMAQKNFAELAELSQDPTTRQLATYLQALSLEMSGYLRAATELYEQLLAMEHVPEVLRRRAEAGKLRTYTTGREALLEEVLFSSPEHAEEVNLAVLGSGRVKRAAWLTHLPHVPVLYLEDPKREEEEEANTLKQLPRNTRAQLNTLPEWTGDGYRKGPPPPMQTVFWHTDSALELSPANMEERLAQALRLMAPQQSRLVITWEGNHPEKLKKLLALAREAGFVIGKSEASLTAHPAMWGRGHYEYFVQALWNNELDHYYAERFLRLVVLYPPDELLFPDAKD